MTLTQPRSEAQSEEWSVDDEEPHDTPRRSRGRRKRLSALGIVLVLVLGGIGWLLWGSPWLRVSNVQVEGASGAIRQPIIDAAQIDIGLPMIRVDKASVHDRVNVLAEVQSARVVRVWPNTVVVQVQERMPVGVVPGPGGQTEVLGSDGHSMAVLATQPADLPELRAAGADLAVLVEVLSHLTPEIVAKSEWASLKDGKVELHFRDEAGVVVWGPPVDNEVKADALAVLIEAAPDATWFDMTAARAPITALERPTRGATPSASPSATSPSGSPADSPSGQEGAAVVQSDGTTNSLPTQPTQPDPTTGPAATEQYGEQPAELASSQQ